MIYSLPVEKLFLNEEFSQGFPYSFQGQFIFKNLRKRKLTITHQSRCAVLYCEFSRIIEGLLV
jgi:hypothetical protein